MLTCFLYSVKFLSFELLSFFFEFILTLLDVTIKSKYFIFLNQTHIYQYLDENLVLEADEESLVSDLYACSHHCYKSVCCSDKLNRTYQNTHKLFY